MPFLYVNMKESFSKFESSVQASVSRNAVATGYADLNRCLRQGARVVVRN